MKLDNILVTQDLSSELRDIMETGIFDEGLLRIAMKKGLRFGDIGTGTQYAKTYAEAYLANSNTCHCKPQQLAVAMFALTYSFLDLYFD